MDYIAPYVAIAQCFGRLGNFFNVEAYGKETESIFRMGIYVEKIYKEVHPTFFYEMIVTFFIFIVLKKIQKNRKYIGQITILYIMLYSFFRFFIEWIRIDSLRFARFRISQVLSLILFIISSVIFCRKLSNEKSSKS